VLSILPYFVKLPSGLQDKYNLITVVASILILTSSLLQYANRDAVKAEQHHRCALEINEIRRLLFIEDITIKEVVVEYTSRYQAVLQKYSINHDALNYQRYQMERPEDYPWLTTPAKCGIGVRLLTRRYMPMACILGWTGVVVALVVYGIWVIRPAVR